MSKFELTMLKIKAVALGLLQILPKRILLALIGGLLAGIARKHPDWPLPTPEEILIGIGVLIGADTVRGLGSGVPTITAPAAWPEARALSDQLHAQGVKDDPKP